MSDKTLREALEDLAGWMDACASPYEPKHAVAGRVSAPVVAERIRALLAAHPEPAPVYEWGVRYEASGGIFARSSEEQARTVAEHYRKVPKLYGKVELLRRAFPHTWEAAE